MISPPLLGRLLLSAVLIRTVYCLSAPPHEHRDVPVPLDLGPSTSHVSYPLADTASVRQSNGSTNETSHAQSEYWVARIKRQGAEPGNPKPFTIYRNVKEAPYGAKGDGVTDDTEAINLAVSDGARCGQGCNSSTISPALVYFPPGTYLVSKPIVQLYQTQFVGDALDPPTLKANVDFSGMAVIDSDPYEPSHFYKGNDNFLRQIRNFVIDLTAARLPTATGIHWQVAQATSLQNIRFEMRRDSSPDNEQQGIFMDDGSGGFWSDLVFNGGHFGIWVGSQQFTTRNLTFNGCDTAIYMNWNWVWAFKSLSVNDCRVGINVTDNPGVPAVGSVLVQDSAFSNTTQPVAASKTAWLGGDSNGTLILDNVDFSLSSHAVFKGDRAILDGGQKIALWAQGREYDTTESSAGVNTLVAGAKVDGLLSPPHKDPSLLTAAGRIFERSRPQYERVPVAKFKSVKAAGALGDGKTDDTAAIQAFLNQISPDEIAYFDHGSYVVSSTIRVPKDIRITGEMWPAIVASGTKFQDSKQPAPVFSVGKAGDVGAVEMSDLLFTTKGPQPGAILMQWNVQAREAGACGLWDVHVRIGGAAGTDLESNTCPGVSGHQLADGIANCRGAFLLFHGTPSSSLYMENAWFWVADHDLDRSPNAKVNIFSDRGVLIESQGPTWLYGTASEHSQLYQYQIAQARGLYMSVLQTETPYYQGNANVSLPAAAAREFGDPDFSSCTTDLCRRAWGLRIVNSSDVLVYGSGLYSFFSDLNLTCSAGHGVCQASIVDVQGSNASLFGLSTKASHDMVTTPWGVVPEQDNRDVYCSTVAEFTEEVGQVSRHKQSV